jgi:hypothetical protein
MAKTRGKYFLSILSTRGFKADIKTTAMKRARIICLIWNNNQRLSKKEVVKIMVRWEISILLGMFPSVKLKTKN